MTSRWHNYKDLTPLHLLTQSGMIPSLVLALALSLCSISAKADFNVFRPLSLSQLLAPVGRSWQTILSLDTLFRMTTFLVGWTTRAAAPTLWWASSPRCRPGCRGPWRSPTTETWSAPSGRTDPFSGELPSGAYQTMQCLRFIYREFMEFKRILRRFKDCVKTGDGIRAKKSQLV